MADDEATERFRAAAEAAPPGGVGAAREQDEEGLLVDGMEDAEAWDAQWGSPVLL